MKQIKSKIKVIIADDHKLVRESWKTVLENDGMFQICALAEDGAEVIAAVKNNKADIILMDINMKPVDGFQAVSYLKRFRPDIKIIAVSMNIALPYIKKIMQLGASGYINKNASISELKNAILEVFKGNTYFCSETKNIFAKNFLGNEVSPIQLLTERELSVIQFLKLGFSSSKIGEQLGISGKTIEVHRHNILKKLKVHNTVSLINSVHEMGL